jgi:hypothetical protein
MGSARHFMVFAIIKRGRIVRNETCDHKKRCVQQKRFVSLSHVAMLCGGRHVPRRSFSVALTWAIAALFTSKGETRMHAICAGVISFGFVQIPVKLYPATRDSTPHFRQCYRARSMRVGCAGWMMAIKDGARGRSGRRWPSTDVRVVPHVR